MTPLRTPCTMFQGEWELSYWPQEALGVLNVHSTNRHIKRWQKTSKRSNILASRCCCVAKRTKGLLLTQGEWILKLKEKQGKAKKLQNKQTCSLVPRHCSYFQVWNRSVLQRQNWWLIIWTNNKLLHASWSSRKFSREEAVRKGSMSPVPLS